MNVNREGIFRATVAEKSVAPKGKNKLTAWQCVFNLIEELAPDEGGDKSFFDITAEGLTISCDSYLEKGTYGAKGEFVGSELNTFTVDKLKEATGWDGRDPFWLEDSLPADLVVRLTIEMDTPSDPVKYKPKLVVKWIDHKDSSGSGGISRATDAEKAMIRSRLGTKLRAIAGGTPAKPPATVGKPALPPAPTPAPTVAPVTTTAPAPVETPKPTRTRRTAAPVIPAPAPVGATFDEAWNAFTAGLTGPTDPAKVDDFNTNVQAQWEKILGEWYPGKGDEDLTPADWLRVKLEAPGKFMPF